jgi:hypothetical protein
MATPAATTGNTAASALPAAGGISESTLSNWAGPYVTNMLGQAQAIASQPYQTYQGPMTAGESGLQSKVFEGLGSLTFPGTLGQSFSSAGAPAMPPANNTVGSASTPYAGGVGITDGQPAAPTGIASQYMNPYLQAVLDPQLAELRRQNDITNMNTNARMTGAGAYGGGRQAIMNAENNRNLMQEMNKTVGQGYATAYDKAMGQFNTEQGQGKDLVNMLANAGAAQRGIEQEGITADYNEFLTQRDDPMKKTQYLQSMLQGLPYQTVTNTPLAKSGIGQLAETVGGMTQLQDALKNLNLG